MIFIDSDVNRMEELSFMYIERQNDPHRQRSLYDIVLLFMSNIGRIFSFLRLPHLEILIERVQASPPSYFYAFQFIIPCDLRYFQIFVPVGPSILLFTIVMSVLRCLNILTAN